MEDESKKQSNVSITKHRKRLPKGSLPAKPKKLPLKDDLKLHKAAYTETLKELKSFKGHKDCFLEPAQIMQKYCYSVKETKFDGKGTSAYSYLQLFAAARKSLENRDFLTLYELIKKGLAQKYSWLHRQMINYFLIAVMNDPAIENKEQAISDFMDQVLMLKTERERVSYLREQFVIGSNVKRSENNEDVDMESLSDASVDGDILKDLRNELHRSET